MNKYYFSSRLSVPISDQWNLQKIFKTIPLWEKSLKKTIKDLPKLSKYQGRLANISILQKFFQDYFFIQRNIEKINIYAAYDFSTDTIHPHKQQRNARAQKLADDFTETTSFFQPELLQTPSAQLKKIVKSPQLKLYNRILEQILHLQKHTLSLTEEKILAQTFSLQNQPAKNFQALDISDLEFKPAILSKNKKAQITHGNFISYLENPDHNLRQKVFTNYYTAYQKHANIYASLLNSKIKQDNLYAKIRKYPNALEASLYSNKIPSKVYTALIESAHQQLKYLYKYFNFKRKKLNLSKLNYWDLRINFTKQKPLFFTYQQAIEIILEALKPLGKEYLKVLKNGLQKGWVDRYENKGKYNGAFSGGSFDTDPYILMNFDGSLNSVFTLIHEGGHSMHSWFSHKNQPYQDSYYTITIAEIASTVNERLLTNYLLKKYKNTSHFIQILLYEIDAIRSTFFRQTMFAEFELKIHQINQQGTELTATILCAEYQKLLKKYHGSAVAPNQLINYEWARILHFYNYEFYVYQYATGIACAYHISEKILCEKPENFIMKYHQLLKSGGNDYPLNQLKKLGIDLTQPQIYKSIHQSLNSLLLSLS